MASSSVSWPDSEDGSSKRCMALDPLHDPMLILKVHALWQSSRSQTSSVPNLEMRRFGRAQLSMSGYIEESNRFCNAVKVSCDFGWDVRMNLMDGTNSGEI